MPGAGRDVDAGLLADRADMEACLARADLFDEGELMQIQVIAVRLRRGIALNAIQRWRLRAAIWRAEREKTRGENAT